MKYHSGVTDHPGVDWSTERLKATSSSLHRRTSLVMALFLSAHLLPKHLLLSFYTKICIPRKHICACVYIHAYTYIYAYIWD